MNKTIVAVDDSPFIRQMLAFALKSAGDALIEAADGNNGLSKAQAGKPDLVLTDQNMSGMDGLFSAAADSRSAADWQGLLGRLAQLARFDPPATPAGWDAPCPWTCKARSWRRNCRAHWNS